MLAERIKLERIVLGREVLVHKHGLGRITEVGPYSGCGGSEFPDWIGVTPYVANYQMNFAPHNVFEEPDEVFNL
jgi:hypothetical protein